MKTFVGNFCFDSNFDNGNLHKVVEVEEFQPLINDTKILKKHEFQDIINSIKGLKLRTIQTQEFTSIPKKETYNKPKIAHVKRYCLWTKPDAYDSGVNVKNRTWFYFSVKECSSLLSDVTNLSHTEENSNNNKNNNLINISNLSESSIDNSNNELINKEKKKTNDNDKFNVSKDNNNENEVNNDTEKVKEHWTILQFRLMNLNNVNRLFNAGMRPVWCSSINKNWKTVSKSLLYEKVNNGLQVTFEVTIPPYSNENISYYFAYCKPYSYSDLQHKILSLKNDYLCYISNSNKINIIDYSNDGTNEKISKNQNNFIKNILIKSNSFNNKKTTSLMTNPKYFWDYLLTEDTNKNSINKSKFTYNNIYFNHQVLIHSYDKLYLDLITISSTKGIIPNKYEEINIEKLFPLKNEEKIKMFDYHKSSSNLNIDDFIKNKKSKKNSNNKKTIIFISSRVHPGEVVSSYITDGIIEFLMRDNDIRSKILRDKYVFKIVPMINPDGVK
ncbi:hypothetical protein BCR32DRAFT_249176 [Anaeromyces robustus]|uniref:Peptidase M14 domain-containing protein n=1 Tax=Anaeromyces robustus TaxID=1754192 RepID=A0A1Y1WQS8_9FUNG|nr:hypothetical protein BCR32DRAFT_249176 [Anaeromyces robustus]|eukprot:ORX75893.1 hypothetical protein BCR32DRAFT_249176 [Anaeromyces robustus]